MLLLLLQLQVASCCRLMLSVADCCWKNKMCSMISDTAECCHSTSAMLLQDVAAFLAAVALLNAVAAG